MGLAVWSCHVCWGSHCFSCLYAAVNMFALAAARDVIVRSDHLVRRALWLLPRGSRKLETELHLKLQREHVKV